MSIQNWFLEKVKKNRTKPYPAIYLTMVWSGLHLRHLDSIINTSISSMFSRKPIWQIVVSLTELHLQLIRRQRRLSGTAPKEHLLNQIVICVKPVVIIFDEPQAPHLRQTTKSLDVRFDRKTGLIFVTHFAIRECWRRLNVIGSPQRDSGVCM